jgi:hypothetical protein
VHARVTSCTNRNQVSFGIITALTAELFVVNFKIQAATAALAFPAITP